MEGHGITAAQGFYAAGVHAGIKKNSSGKNDLAIVFSEKMCEAAGVFTQNKVRSHCIAVTQSHLANGKAQAIVVNSGNANACNGSAGFDAAKTMAAHTAALLGIAAEDVLVASTGVIGAPFDTSVVTQGILSMKGAWSKAGNEAAVTAIMTTDTRPKSTHTHFFIGSHKVVIGAIAKGSGMIHPNMATLLCFISTDCAISAGMLKQALAQSIDRSLNCVSVDADTSTNDMALVLANGMAENPPIIAAGPAFDAFCLALDEVTIKLAKMIAADGEGATKLIECTVSGAVTIKDAQLMARSVISSNLVKTAIAGADANWGRILCAMGYSGAQFNPDTVSIAMISAKQRVELCERGNALAFDEGSAHAILLGKEICIDITLADGTSKACAWGCDLTCEYVNINASYRT